MTGGWRGISTVADVSLALVVLVAAIGVVSTSPAMRSNDTRPSDAPHTTETIAASTLDATYSLESVTATEAFPNSTGEYDEQELERVVHGAVAGQIADGTLANLTFDTDSGTERLSISGKSYREAIEEGLQARLVESNFETHVTAHWIPFEGASIRGEITLGEQPPTDTDTSLSTLRVSSGIPPARSTALTSVENETDYDVVAELAAESILQGLFPERATQRGLEASGLDRDLLVYRYRRLATVLDETSPADAVFQHSITREGADVAALNEHLATAIATQLESDLRQHFDSAHEAARELSLSTVVITVRTWER